MVSREKGSLASMNKTYGKAGVFAPEVAASEIMDLFGDLKYQSTYVNIYI
jgi:hypothetical protein